VIGRLVALGLWAVCLGCAHGRGAGLDDRSAALLVAIRYTMLELADPGIRAADPGTWVPFCIDVDEKPAPTNVLEALRLEGFNAHGELRHCVLPESDRGKNVHVNDLQIRGDTATANVGVDLG